MSRAGESRRRTKPNRGSSLYALRRTKPAEPRVTPQCLDIVPRRAAAAAFARPAAIGDPIRGIVAPLRGRLGRVVPGEGPLSMLRLNLESSVEMIAASFARRPRRHFVGSPTRRGARVAPLASSPRFSVQPHHARREFRMLKPSVQIHHLDGFMLAEFWDCLRLDPAPVRDLRTRYEEHLRGGGRPDLVVDLAGVEFAGSAALGGFVALRRIAGQNGGRVIFCHVEPTVAEAFRASNLGKLFDFAADREAALAAARSKPGEDQENEQTAAEPRPRPASPPSAGLGRLRRGRPTTDPE